VVMALADIIEAVCWSCKRDRKCIRLLQTHAAVPRGEVCLCGECLVTFVERLTGFKLTNWFKTAQIQSGLKVSAAERRRRRSLRQERIV
jgi:hypothetical protein